MYKNPQFEEKDPDKVLAFMEAHPFITLIGYNGNYPVATQTPVYIVKEEDKIRLIGHVMKKTDHYEAYASNENVLALFTGAHTYVSASVYEKPAVASTWNYSAVHVKGKISLMDDDGTHKVIEQLTNSFEDPYTSPAAFNKIDSSYVDKHLKAISGFEIVVEEINSVFKLSQNHSIENRNAIIADLGNRNDADSKQVARDMRKY